MNDTFEIALGVLTRVFHDVRNKKSTKLNQNRGFSTLNQWTSISSRYFFELSAFIGHSFGALIILSPVQYKQKEIEQNLIRVSWREIRFTELMIDLIDIIKPLCGS